MVTETHIHEVLTSVTWIGNLQKVLLESPLFDLLMLRPTLLAFLLVSLQLILLYLLGVWGTRLLRSRHRQVSQLWLYIVWMALLLVPFHVLVGGWSLEAFGPEGVITSPSQQADTEPLGHIQTQIQPLTGAAGRNLTLHQQPPIELDQEVDPGMTVTHDRLTAELSTQSDRETRWSSRVQTNASGWRWSREWFGGGITREHLLMRTILGFYFGVVAWFLVSNLRGALLLRSLRRHGQPIDRAARLNIEAAAQQMQLRNLPEIIECADLSVPLTCGILRPLVLVPHGFSTWESEEQHMVLLHEFAHIQRRDLAGELLARGMTILFWFHPASWFIVRQHRAARELATDELVVVTGADRFRYAVCLVSVIERMSQLPRAKKSLPVVAMSTSRNIESRISALVDGSRGPARNCRLMWIIIAFISVTLYGSSFHLQTADSAQAQDRDRQSTDDDAKGTALLTEEAAGVLRFDTDLLKSSVSLTERIENCIVTPVVTDSHGPIFNVSGVVKNPDGSPAVDATVILRESPQLRVSSDTKLLGRSDRHLLAVPDVFAKTKTDAQGRYEFNDVKSPELPNDRFQNNWEWNVIAVSGDCFCALQLDSARIPIKTLAQADITLEKTQTIRATVVNANGEAVPNAIVQLSGLSFPGQLNQVMADGQLQREFIAWMSVFTPIVLADARGEVAFTHVPTSRVASLHAIHPDYVGGSSFVATSDDVPLGEAVRPSTLNDPRFLTQASPAKIEMEVGQRIRGRVLAQGKPVAGVKIGLRSNVPSTETDGSGSFELRFSAVQARGDQVQILLIPPEGSNLIYCYRNIEAEELEAEEPIDIELFPGVRIVGQVLCNGKPAPNIRISATHVPGESELMFRGSSSTQQGTFEIVVPPHSTKVFLTTDEPGYKLARNVNGRAALAGTVPENWPQKDLPISGAEAGQTIELEPFIIEATDSIAIQAVLPNGELARQGVVTVKDKSSLSPRHPDERLSVPTMLDESGRTQVKLAGLPSSDAYVEVHLITETGGFAGSKLLRDIGPGEVLTIELQAGMIIRGTVTLNGKPIRGAQVTISKSEPVNERGGFRSLPLVTVETNEAGKYSAGVERATQYSVFVQGVPGVQDQISQGHGARPSATGVVEVSQFDFQTGLEEIEGVVLDANRRPIEGVSVSVEPKFQPSGRPILLGWRTASQLSTDQQGRFFLRNLPKGEYQIRAYSRQNGQGINLTAQVEAATGDKNVKIFIETDQPPPMPRLRVHSISDY